jgi:hypothetical protein
MLLTLRVRQKPAGPILRLSNSLYESRIRKSIRKSDVGFCWDLTFVTHPTFVSLAIRLFRNGKRKYLFRLSETKVRYESQILKLKYFCIGETKVETRSGYESPKQTNSRANGSRAFPEDIEAPSASSKTPACKTCFVLVACIVAFVKAPAVSDVAASANIHTAPLRRNANNGGTNSRLPAIRCNI